MPTEQPHQPPDLASSFLSWFCPDWLIEDIEGDLYELFQERVEQRGLLQARLWYWWNVCWFLRPYLLTERDFEFRPNPDMWKNYAKIALRQMRRAPLFSGINIAGLSLGIASCVVMLLFVQDELNFDGTHPDRADIYRIVEARTNDQGSVDHIADTAGPLGPAMVTEIAGVEAAARVLDLSSVGRFTIRHGERERHEGDYIIAGPSFLEMFEFGWLEGDRNHALDAPATVVVTESAAEFYFESEDVLGKTLSAGRFGDFTVTGLVPDPPNNSHLQFNMILSYASLEAIQGWRDFMDNWDSNGFITYVRLNGSTNPAAVSQQLRGLSDTHRSAEAWESRAFSLQALSDVHFGSGHIVREHNAGKSTRSFLYVFVGIALLIALIACINYMNLSTARAMRRAKEVGLRKAVGARRSQLVSQFLGESLITSTFALLVGLVIVLFVLPAFNAFTGKELSLASEQAGGLILATILTTMIVGVISGSYPALYVSRFRPAQVLRRLSSGGREGRFLRDGLVVTQFALSIVLVVATLAAMRQFEYIQEKDLGYDQTQLVVLDINSSAARNGFDGMKQAFGQLAAVEGVSVSSRVPGDWKAVPVVALDVPGGSVDQRVEATFMGVDADFLDTYSIDLVDGRHFSEELLTDSTAFLINQTAARALGIASATEQPLGIADTNFGGQWIDRGYDGRVVGIVEDFHFQSLHEPIQPIVLGFRNNPIHSIDYFTLRASTADIPGLLAQLTAIQERFDPDTPLEYNFLESRLADNYVEDRRAGTVFGIATILALLIACFGLFGLASFVAEQRTKEVGVRKALGASVGQITLMMSGSFTRLVLISLVLAAAPAWWVTNRWLSDFAYRVSVGPGTILLAGLAALIIAWITVSYQSIRVASTDPVRALRYE